MRAYSSDLRERIVLAVERGMSRREAVTTFGVSLGTIKRLVARRRTAQDLTPQSPPGRPRSIAGDHHAAVWAQLEASPDATVDEHTRRWNTAHGTTLSSRTVGRAIARLGWTRKKRRWQPPNVMNRSGSSSATG